VNSPKTLGLSLYVTGYAFQGKVPTDKMTEILQKTVSFIGMDTAGLPPKIWYYPLESGQGGQGETICQPLVESFLISDAWPDLDKIYVVLASCRKYNVCAVSSFLEKEIGPLLGIGHFKL
jgi:hypothetical protein